MDKGYEPNTIESQLAFDGRGSERAGRVIAAFLEGLDAGKTRDQSLKDAIDGFARKWGQDKVTVFGQKKDH
jgi:hypothetical protein